MTGIAQPLLRIAAYALAGVVAPLDDAIVWQEEAGQLIIDVGALVDPSTGLSAAIAGGALYWWRRARQTGGPT